MFQLLAKINSIILPCFTKSGLDLMHAKKWQKALLAYRYWVTVKSLH
jgi:hypothetical protein